MEVVRFVSGYVKLDHNIIIGFADALFNVGNLVDIISVSSGAAEFKRREFCGAIGAFDDFNYFFALIGTQRMSAAAQVIPAPKEVTSTRSPL